MLMEISITRVSSRGQVVIPRELREEANLNEGDKLMVYGNGETIVLKRIEPSIKEFEKLASFGKKFAAKKCIKKSEVLEDD